MELAASGQFGATPVTMRRYVAALLGGALLLIAVLAGLLTLLDRSGLLPPPQFANSLCLDEKLLFMRDNPPHDINLLVVGSSEAWRSFNSHEAIRFDPSLRPYNAGFCGENITQSAAVISWLVTRTPSTERVLLILAPSDLEGCSTPSHSSFNLQDVDEFVFERRPKLQYYMKYFDANTMVRNAIGLSRYRRETKSFGSLYIDRFGDGPLDPDSSRGLYYGAPKIDKQCFGGVNRIARLLARRNVKLFVAAAPTNPAWRKRYDPEASILSSVDREILNALDGSNAAFIKADELPETAFFDAYHVRWSSTPEFTRSLLKKMD